MKWTKRQIRYFWRIKYPWFFVMYILLIGILRGILNNAEPEFAMNLLMMGAFVSYIFLYIFYLYGVRPEEMEDWHKKYHTLKRKKINKIKQ